MTYAYCRLSKTLIISFLAQRHNNIDVHNELHLQHLVFSEFEQADTNGANSSRTQYTKFKKGPQTQYHHHKQQRFQSILPLLNDIPQTFVVAIYLHPKNIHVLGLQMHSWLQNFHNRSETLPEIPTTSVFIVFFKNCKI